jgi:hypothetical protein
VNRCSRSATRTWCACSRSRVELPRRDARNATFAGPQRRGTPALALLPFAACRGPLRSTASARAQPVNAAKTFRASPPGVASASFMRQAARSVAAARACRAGRPQPRASSPRCLTEAPQSISAPQSRLGRGLRATGAAPPREMRACRALGDFHRRPPDARRVVKRERRHSAVGLLKTISADE